MRRIDIDQWIVKPGDKSRTSRDEFTELGAEAINNHRQSVFTGKRVPVCDLLTAEAILDKNLTPEKRCRIIREAKDTPF